jgi:hypothetical protein
MASTFKITTVETDPQRVLLFERDYRHPNGEAFVASDGETYEVGDTPAVRGLLAMQDEGGNELVKRGAKAPRGNADLADGDEVEMIGLGGAGGANPGFTQGGEHPGQTADEDGQTNTGSANPGNPDPGKDSPNLTAPGKQKK